MTELSDRVLSAGYILIRAGNGDVHDLQKRLLSVKGVKVVHPLIGPDDLICYLETHDPSNFRFALDKGIRRLIDEELIERTETLIILAERGDGFFGKSKEYQPAPAAAWLLCDLAQGDPQPIVDKLTKKFGVVSADPVLGRYDLVVHVEAKSLDALMEILDNSIRGVVGIRSTDTRLVLMKPGEHSLMRSGQKLTTGPTKPRGRGSSKIKRHLSRT